MLKKYKADVFVSPDGFCSLATKIPQCLVVHDLAFLHYPGFNQKSHLRFNKKYTGKFLQKASTIATVSAFSKQDILRHYKVDAGKFHIVYSAASEIFQPLAGTEKDEVKKRYSGNREYFMYAGSIHPRKRGTP